MEEGITYNFKLTLMGSLVKAVVHWLRNIDVDHATCLVVCTKSNGKYCNIRKTYLSDFRVILRFPVGQCNKVNRGWFGKVRFS